MMWMKWIALFCILVVVCIGLATIYGKFRWQLDTDNLRAKLGSGQRIIKPQIYDQKEIEDLPAPVQRFFRTVFKDGQPIASAVKFTHQGEFNMGEKKAKWSPFTSTQFVITQRPGFDWDARIQMAPGLKIFRFNTEGLISTIRAEARYRTVWRHSGANAVGMSVVRIYGSQWDADPLRGRSSMATPGRRLAVLERADYRD